MNTRMQKTIMILMVLIEDAKKCMIPMHLEKDVSFAARIKIQVRFNFLSQTISIFEFLLIFDKPTKCDNTF